MYLKIVVGPDRATVKSIVVPVFGAQQKVKLSKQNPDAHQEKERHQI